MKNKTGQGTAAEGTDDGSRAAVLRLLTYNWLFNT